MPNTSLTILKKRPDFKAAAQTNRRWVAPAFILQVKSRTPDGPSRYGITATRKVGNAVKRNFMKRRFRALCRLVLPALGRPGTDYVLIARSEASKRSFPLMIQDLEKALKHFENQGEEK